MGSVWGSASHDTIPVAVPGSAGTGIPVSLCPSHLPCHYPWILSSWEGAGGFRTIFLPSCGVLTSVQPPLTSGMERSHLPSLSLAVPLLHCGATTFPLQLSPLWLHLGIFHFLPFLPSTFELHHFSELFLAAHLGFSGSAPVGPADP